MFRIKSLCVHEHYGRAQSVPVLGLGNLVTLNFKYVLHCCLQLWFSALWNLQRSINTAQVFFLFIYSTVEMPFIFIPPGGRHVKSKQDEWINQVCCCCLWIIYCIYQNVGFPLNLFFHVAVCLLPGFCESVPCSFWTHLFCKLDFSSPLIFFHNWQKNWSKCLRESEKGYSDLASCADITQCDSASVLDDRWLLNGSGLFLAWLGQTRAGSGPNQGQNPGQLYSAWFAMTGGQGDSMADISLAGFCFCTHKNSHTEAVHDISC